MHIMHFKAMLPVSKIEEILQVYRGHKWPIVPRQVGTHWNVSKFWEEFLIFDHFTINFGVIFKFNVSKKLYLCVCRCLQVYNSMTG